MNMHLYANTPLYIISANVKFVFMPLFLTKCLFSERYYDVSSLSNGIYVIIKAREIDNFFPENIF